MWRIWIDTGGTFADCIGVDPEGRVHRAKVLSSSALRGRIAGVGGRGDLLYVEQDWNAPSRFIDGMRLRVAGLTQPETEPRVVGFDADRSVIRIDRSFGEAAAPGAVFEVASDDESPILAARLVTRTPAGVRLPPIEMRLGTTRATNALLERAGAPVALFITRGFRDLLEIGTQQRPELFALRIERPAVLYSTVVEVPERLAADGSVLLPMDAARLEGEVRRVLESGIRSAAIGLLHAWLNPEHERALETFLRLRGFEHVSRSSDLSPTIKILPRAETSVVNAHLAPLMEGYVGRIAAGLGAPVEQTARRTGALVLGENASTLRIMTSAGGIVGAGAFRPKDSLLSGPAGGVIGAAAAAARSGVHRAISFDMGGTSTDVARIEDTASGEYEYVFEHEVGAGHVAAPALAVESVAAGGGSICWFDSDELRVGPRSAGANPGPACYGMGGPLTITDLNLLLGRIDPRGFAVPVDAEPARRRFDELRDALNRAGRKHDSAESLMESLLEIGCDRMAEAIRRISVRRGFDPAGYALVAFGGAGPQHACRVAEALGMASVLVPADAGLLCSLGLGHAGVERIAERQVLRLLDQCASELPDLVQELSEEALRGLEGEGITRANAQVRRTIVHARLAGQESTLALDWSPELRTAFGASYRAIYGHAPEKRGIEVESIRVVARSRGGAARIGSVRGPTAERPPGGRRRVWFGGKWGEADVYNREALGAGAVIAGPALITEPHSTCVVEPGWAARVDAIGSLLLARDQSAPVVLRKPASDMLEVTTARLASIATEMGEMLRRTALSVNVKERLDFSCALLDAQGRLVVNAPHIPVHLGSLGVCVRALRERIEMGQGDVVATNHPAVGGSHLPDITVVTPVHIDDGTLLAYVASRAHHAEIGGVRPGSMPFDARSLHEEGVVISPVHLIRRGEERWEDIRRLLSAGPFPSRGVEDNLADLRAQVAANARGAAGVRQFVAAHGAAALAQAMSALTDRAARRVRDAVRRYREGAGPAQSLKRSSDRAELAVLNAHERFDDGTPLSARIILFGQGSDPWLRIDFSGTGGVHSLGLNATPAIVRSAVMYVLRLLVDEPMPLNEGLLDGVELIVPDGLLNPPFVDDAAKCPPVAAGNTETSQRLVEVLLKALGACAGSQGTMNNVAFGDDRFGYYETVCGGAGAGLGFHGASAVHTHMTNTRITDPEVMERRYPVRLERFAIRRGSGGKGRWHGGNGVEREITFLRTCSLSLLTQHRAEGPSGLGGGLAGAPGRQWVIRATGDRVEVPAIGGCEVGPGDRLVLQTPGGGGAGAA